MTYIYIYILNSLIIQGDIRNINIERCIIYYLIGITVGKTIIVFSNNMFVILSCIDDCRAFVPKRGFELIFASFSLGSFTCHIVIISVFSHSLCKAFVHV